MADVLKGKNLILFISGATGTTMVGQIKGFDIKKDAELQEYTDITCGDYKNYMRGTIDWNLSMNGYVTSATTDGALLMEDKFNAGSSIPIVIGLPTVDSTTTKATGFDSSKTYWSGSVMVNSWSLSNGGNGELLTFSCEGKGIGAYSRTDK